MRSNNWDTILRQQEGRWNNMDALLAAQNFVAHKKEKGGFFDLPKNTKCGDSEHEPPKYLHIPQGKGYRHVCPRCGQVKDIIPPQVTM